MSWESFWQSNFLALVGWTVGVLAVAKLMRERRRPGNILAWFFIIGFLPLVGVILFLLFGGRKYANLARRKQQVRALTARVAQRDVTHAPIPGHSLELLPDGKQTLTALLAEIAKAQRRIIITVYAWLPDAVGLAVLDALTARAREGVEVYCLVDALGSQSLKGRHVRTLRAAGGRFAWFSPVWSLRSHYVNLRNHRKAFIFDEQRALVGGQNIDERFMAFDASTSPCFVDFSVRLAGPCVAELLHDFVCDWCFTTREPVERYRHLVNSLPYPEGTAAVEVIPSGPDTDDDRVWELFADAMQQSRKHIIAVTPYFVPDNVLLYSLLLRARHGCQVDLVVPLRSNQPLADLARSRYLRMLHDADAKVWLLPGPTVHGKLLIVDDAQAFFGSPNLDQRSLFLNYETAISTTHAPTIQALKVWANSLCQQSQPFATSAERQRRWPRLLGEDATHLLEPLL